MLNYTYKTTHGFHYGNAINDMAKKIEKEMQKKEKIMHKEDLKEQDIIELRNGELMILLNDGELTDLDDCACNSVTCLDDFNEYLRHENFSDYDIVSVRRPISYKEFDVNHKVVEVTMEEVCEKFGYDVKIIKD